MKMNRIAFILIIILSIFMELPAHFGWSIAKAEELPTIADGVYQVELSFLSLGAVEQGGLFSEKAMLTVDKGQYTLSMKYTDITTITTVKQQDGSSPFQIDKAENLVQFDVKNLQQPIVIEGMIEKASEETSIYFSEQITIHTNGLPPLIIEPDDEEKPSPPISEGEVKEAFIAYLLLADGTDEPSIMNTYVDPLIKIIKKENKYYAQMNILKSSWITNLTVEQQGKMIAPETISLVDNHRLIQFEVEEFGKKVRLWVQVDIPELAYHHQYYVQLQFDEEQLAAFLGEAVKPEKPKPGITNPDITEPNKTPSEDIQQKPKSNQQTIAPTPEPEKQSSPMTIKPSLSLPLPEETLSFNRQLDEFMEKEEAMDTKETKEVAEEKKDAGNESLDLAPLDKMKIGLLVIVCIVSGILLIRRIKKAKKVDVDE